MTTMRNHKERLGKPEAKEVHQNSSSNHADSQPTSASVNSIQPLLELIDVTRSFSFGERSVTVLKEINLKVYAGELIAIIGASGSGKSTLMNLLGCLDRPTSGTYKIDGEEIGNLGIEALARLRREHFGFIFQRYHLLPHLRAIENVAMPAIYAGISQAQRMERALQLLQQLGLSERAWHRPNQLSGGQQQRVSIARALMNGGAVILADEPTGALDSQSGQAVLQILHELHALGHTIIIVTHNDELAAQASRIIEISDGAIVRDEINPQAPTQRTQALPDADLSQATPTASTEKKDKKSSPSAWLISLRSLTQACKIAWLALRSHRLRTSLTLLGIIIGIASVVTISAIGEGAKNAMLKDIRSLGPNTINIYRGRDFGDRHASRVRTLLPGDLTALREQSYVDSVTPNISRSLLVRYGNVDTNVNVRGVGTNYFQARDIRVAQGMFFQEEDLQRQAQIVVIDANTRKKFFGPNEDPLGQIIFLRNLPTRIVGVAQEKKELFGGADNELNIWLPYTTASAKLLGQHFFDSITVRLRDGTHSGAAELSINKLLKKRHRRKDFFTYNLDSALKTAEKVSRSLTLLLALIGAISLLVGGIGVMNIMLVSVTERTREIGLRMAVGARRVDILQQFLVEAVMVCLLGGAIGILLSFSISFLLPIWAPQWRMIFSTQVIISAFLASTLIGILFGFMPARNASLLNPVDALARD